MSSPFRNGNFSAINSLQPSIIMSYLQPIEGAAYRRRLNVGLLSLCARKIMSAAVGRAALIPQSAC